LAVCVIPEFESPYEGATQRIDRINTFDIERVEVFKGPASALHPNNAFGGVINVVSRDAPLIPETQVSIEAGDFNRLRAGLSTGGRVDDVGYFFDINTRSLDGIRDGAVNDRDQISGQLIYQLSGATRLATRLEYFDEFRVARGDLSAQELEINPTQAGGLNSSEDLSQSMLSIKLEHILISGKLDLDLVRREKDTVGESRFRGPQNENDLGYSAKIMYLHDIDNASFIVGYDGYRGEQDVNQYARGDSELTGQFDAYINHLDIDAYFTQYQFSPGDNLMLTAGLRYENIVLSSTSYADTAEFSDLAPKLGLTYQLNSDHMIWVGVSEGFYAPDLDD
jgi:outer membrane receptor protein involved in Fe transport